MDKGTVKTKDIKKAKELSDDGVPVELTDGKKAKPDYLDLDGDGNKKETMKKAAQDKKKQEVEEGKAGKILVGAALVAALLGINKASSEKIYNSSPKIKSLTSKYEQAKKDGDKEKMADYKEQIKKEKIKVDRGLNEGKKTIELPADTTFTLDLKHLMKKHLDEGKSKEDVIKLTKALMNKLHDKGEVKVNGTKILFKEMDAPMELPEPQLALPEPDAPDFLGDDGMDYEGGMAKSQLLKMKKYAMDLCDMIEDETQLEAWVQAKLTKASDYMSSVFHYLEYQNQKNERPDQGIY